MSRLYKTDKAVLHFVDPGGEFFQGYAANSLEAPRSAFVDIKGRNVATFDQKKIGEEEVLIVLQKEAVEPLKEHLGKYLPISKAEIRDTELKVYFDLEGTEETREGEYAFPQKKGQLIATPFERKSEVSEEEFTRFRLEHEIPLQYRDYNREMLLNIDEEEYFAPDKGCFLGQEILSRVHFRSKPPKKLVVKKEGDCTEGEVEKMTSVVEDGETGEKKGFLFVSNK